jgi:hypothetical protein
MKTGVVIPTRGDRPKFLSQAKKLLNYQTKKPDETYIVDFPPVNGIIDITKRYHMGITHLTQTLKCDLVIFWEDDDWYSKDYIETISSNWVNYNKPDMIGFGKTIYYHLFTKKYIVINHPTKASACCTAVSKNILNYKFPDDSHPYLDSFLWKQSSNNIVLPVNNFQHIGFKHGIGMTGGGGHKTNWEKYNQDDTNLDLLKNTLDTESMKFYLEF